MELLSNLIWMVFSLVLLVGTWRAARRGRLRVSRRAALVLVALVCVLLLPVLSQSDDLLMAQEMQLPVSSQTWHLASQDASSALEIFTLACELLLIGALLLAVRRPERRERRSEYSDWIARAYGTRPPPAFAV